MAAELRRRPAVRPLFFFGTLMDVDVLAEVLARPVSERELSPACLWSYRRHAVIGAPYPVVRPAADTHVIGRVFAPLGEGERARIEHFESEEYAAAPVRVQSGTRMIEVSCFLDLDGVFEVAAHDWSLHRFQAVDKPRYLAACRGWMVGYADAAVPTRRSA